MNAADEIRAAIDKLTEMKALSSLGPWEIDATDEYFNARFDSVRVMRADTNPAASPYDRYIIVDGSYAMDPGGFSWSDAHLIVTLHATIDAQLAILNFAAKNYWEPGDAPEDWESFEESQAILALARSINGATS